MLKSVEFWIAVGIAIIVKMRTSERLTLGQNAATVFVAVGSAYIGAEWVAGHLGLGVPIAAALVALTAEGLMRWILLALADPAVLIRLWKELRK